MLMDRVATPETLAGVTATYIVPTRAKADNINTTEYKKLDTPEHEYTAKLKLNMSKCRECAPIHQKVVDFEADYLMSSRAIPRIQLKVGTHVMCTHNINSTLCNGSQGIVRRFECGGLPVVEFLHDNVERIMHYVTIESEKVPLLAVSYMPLMYAWAITIHKAQGATLHAAVIDIGSGIFEKGQTYTALSRLSSLDHLYLTSFDPSRIKTDPLVLSFYQKLGKSE
jgi:ATP-dependent DNA helicase PIF1